MIDKLRKFVDDAFADAPDTEKTQQLREELLANLIEKYKDLLVEGKSMEEAYKITCDSLGDVSSLFSSEDNRTITTAKQTENRTSGAYYDNSNDKNYNKRVIINIIGIMLYILCVLPVIILDDYFESFGIVLMFIMVAVATACVIYASSLKPKKVNVKKESDTIVDEFKQWKNVTDEEKKKYKEVCKAISAVTLAVYLVVSFITMKWWITWLIWPIAGCIKQIVKAAFEISNSGKKGY